MNVADTGILFMNQEFNTDIIPEQNIRKQFPILGILLGQSSKWDSAETEFGKCEIASVKAKWLYDFLGTVNIIAVTLVFLSAVWGVCLTLAGFDTWSSSLAIVGMISGIVSLSIYGYVWFFDLRDKWLVNRFICERFRLFHFQQCLDGKLLGLIETNPKAFEREYNQRLDKISTVTKLNKGAQNDFADSKPRLFVKSPSIPVSGAVQKELFEVYGLLRIGKQKEYFSWALGDRETKSMSSHGISNTTFLLGALVAFIETLLVLKFFEVSTPVAPIVTGVALTLSVLAYSINMYRNAAKPQEEVDRCRQMKSRLESIWDRFHEEEDPERRLGLMVECEDLCANELKDFLNTMKKSDYFA